MKVKALTASDQSHASEVTLGRHDSVHVARSLAKRPRQERAEDKSLRQAKTLGLSQSSAMEQGCSFFCQKPKVKSFKSVI